MRQRAQVRRPTDCLLQPERMLAVITSSCSAGQPLTHAAYWPPLLLVPLVLPLRAAPAGAAVLVLRAARRRCCSDMRCAPPMMCA